MRHLWSWLAPSRAARRASGHSSAPPRRAQLAVERLEERSTPAVIGTGSGLTAQYYSDYSFSNLVLTRTDSTINLNSAVQPLPAPGVPGLRFSVRWTGQIQAEFSETCTFTTVSDDGIRVTVNGQQIINDWNEHPPKTDSGSLALTAGQKYNIEVDFFQNIGGFVAQLSWASPSLPKQLVPASQLYPALGSSVGDWFSQNLQDAGVRSLARTLDADKQLSRGDMLAIFQEVEQDGQVTAVELHDLRTLVANAGPLGMPDPVQNLANKVVNSDPANLQYQGQPLGNLTTGATAGQLQNLVNKWFLGLDHPTIAPGLHYAAASGSIFGSSPLYSDIIQGNLSDCYFLASLSALAYRDSSAIKSMFIDNGDGTFTVRFFNNGQTDYVTVDRQLPATTGGNFYYAGAGGSLGNVNNKLWVQLAEKAYAQLAASGWSRGSGAANAYTALNIGWEGNSIEQVGNRVATPNQLFSDTMTLNALVQAVQSSQIVAIDSDATTDPGIVANHVYVVLSYTSATQTFTCYNPWGYVQQLTWAQVQGNFSYWTQA